LALCRCGLALSVRFHLLVGRSKIEKVLKSTWMRQHQHAQRTLPVRDNSGATRVQLIHSKSYANPMVPVSRVFTATSKSKGISRGSCVSVYVLYTGSALKGKNGVCRRHATGAALLVNVTENKTTLIGTRMMTKLPKSMVGKGRSLSRVY
jgi:ribosomal protein L14